MWTGLSGTFANALLDNTSWTAPDAQTTDQEYVLRRTATDDDGATGSDTVTITVLGDNIPVPPEGVTFDLRHRAVGDSDWITVEDINALTYTATGLDHSTDNEAQVRAKRGGGESDWSPSGTGTTSIEALDGNAGTLEWSVSFGTATGSTVAPAPPGISWQRRHARMVSVVRNRNRHHCGTGPCGVR